jgi:hypothetical protein
VCTVQNQSIVACTTGHTAILLFFEQRFRVHRCSLTIFINPLNHRRHTPHRFGSSELLYSRLRSVVFAVLGLSSSSLTHNLIARCLPTTSSIFRLDSQLWFISISYDISRLNARIAGLYGAEEAPQRLHLAGWCS